MSGANSSVELVQTMYQRLQSGDIGAARALWTDDAVWHLHGDHELARDYTPDAYLALLGRWVETYPQYQAEYTEVRNLGEDMAMIAIESSGGMAPGPASGLLLFRVVDGKIREGWAIPTFGGGRYAF